MSIKEYSKKIVTYLGDMIDKYLKKIRQIESSSNTHY